MRRTDAGFTLIELLVVIAIIAILVALLFAVFVGAKEHAKQQICLANLRQMAAAFQRYSTDNNGVMPAAGWGGLPNWCGSMGDGLWVYPERGQLWRYIRNRDIFWCPVDRNRQDRVPRYVKTSAPPPGLHVWDYPLSYSMNNALEKKKADALSIRKPSKMLLLIHEDRVNINDGILLPDAGQTRDIPDHVHYTGTTAAYIDGHARWAGKDDLSKERDAGYWTVR